MRRLDNLDLYQINELLDDDERRVRDAVREWVDARVLPHIEQWAWDCHCPAELVAEMGSLDLLGAPYQEYGLPGLNAVAYGLINQELERGDSALRSFVSVQTSLVMYPILEWGSQGHKDRWIPALGRGEAIDGNDAHENSRPVIIDDSVGSIEVGLKYSTIAPTNNGTIKKKGGAANICALSFWLCIFQIFLEFKLKFTKS